MKHHDNKIYQNKPKKDRKYLLQPQTPNFSYKQIDRLEGIRQSLRNMQNGKKKSIQKTNQSEKESLAERAKRYRKRIITERSTITQRSLEIHQKIVATKKTTREYSETKIQQKIYNKRNRRNLLTIQDKERTITNEIKRLPLKLSQLVSPFIVNNQRKSMPDQPFILARSNQKRMKHPKMRYNIPENVLNFTPKYKSLNKMPNQGFHLKDLKKQFLKGFIREQKLGKGGFSEVWSAFQLKTGKRYAIKQMSISNKYQTHLAQIAFSSYFFENGQPRPAFINHPGINVLLLMHGYSTDNQKAYVLYQKCNGALGQYLFEIFQQNSQDQALNKKYVIIHKPLYEQMRTSTFFLKSLIFQMSQALQLFQRQNIVHSDMKTSNILIKLSENSQKYTFKLIDYGSSFFFANLNQYRLATPQYMPPELITYLNFRSGKQYNEDLFEFTKNYTNISAIDMWGLGCIILQIIYGVPVWLHNQVKFEKQGKIIWKSGLFATQTRIYSEILQKQLSLINNLDHFLQTQNNTRVALDKTIITILKGLLKVNPGQRMQPKQVLKILSFDFQ